MIRPLVALSAIVAMTAIAEKAAAQQAADATTLEEISVEGRASGAGTGQGSGAPGVATNDGYVPKTTRTGTKTDTPVNEVPITISTVTQSELEDRRPQTLEEALAYTPGARTGAFGFNPRFDSFFIRGVDVGFTGVFRDGLRQFTSPSGQVRLEPYGLESISILKGPASSVYGASSSVGIVDLVSKRPTDYKFGEVEVQGGSFDRKQVAFDIGGPVNESGTVLYRFTALARDASTSIPGYPDNRVFVAPAVTFQPNDDTKLTLLGEFMDSKSGGSSFFDNDTEPYTLKDGTVTNQPTGVSDSALYNSDYNDFSVKQGRVGYEFEHSFSDMVSVHQNLRWSALSTNERFGTTTYAGLVKESLQSLAADTYLKTRIATGPVNHTLLTGIDIGRSSYNSRNRYNFAEIADPDLPEPTRQEQTLIGAYVQDEAKAGPWRLLVGGRHDWLDSRYFAPSTITTVVDPAGVPTDVLNPSQTTKQDKGAFTGRAGLSYVTEYGLTPYVSAGNSFIANPGTVINGGVAKPTRGKQVEAGVKYDVPGHNTFINASIFWLKQTDGIVYTVVNSVNQQTQLDFRSQGFEIESNTSLANGINVKASYSFIDTKITKLSPDTEGNQLNSIPKHSFSIWGSYDVPTGLLKGFGFGAGVRHTGSNFGDDYNRAVIKNKPVAYVDANISYDFEALDPKLKGVSAQVNAENLLDKENQVCSASYCYLNQGRKVIASLRYRW
ncbi:TonB-dependent siderophore receptor [Hansschlegelia quercus]|uniref:TonB-dependent siderophore receptor n=1 Tax=Hansschlegelia quercus TaxID=2528245 RepID=A0A4Q9GCI1_9HYPH|nr:TonB-dependent siderophore receptor [Hansschlegelia quercus]TBN47673.1 TonB-dependent siderophore receptor [Hansschlegelia quercus]